MKRARLAVLALAVMPFAAWAGDDGLFYVAAGTGKGGGNFGIGVGTDVDVLEISSLALGTVSGNASARFKGLSLLQYAKPAQDLSLLFRLGIGKTTTTFADGSHASRMGYTRGVIFGLGAQYRLNSHLAFRGELNRVSYAATADGLVSGVSYPLTISAMYIF